MKVLLLFLMVSSSVLSQDNYIEFRLSFDNPEQQLAFSTKDTTAVTIIVKNNATRPYRFFNSSCSQAIRSMGFEIITSDSTYRLIRQERIVIRNVPYHDEILPGDSLLWSVDIVDSALIDNVFGKGFVGMPSSIDTKAYIRFRYELDTIDAKMIDLSHLKEEYIDYLDGDIESSIFYADDDTEEKTTETQETRVVTPETSVRRRRYVVDESLLIGVFYSPPIPLVYRE